MSYGTRSVAATAGALAIVLTVGSTTPALAQPAAGDLPSVLRGFEDAVRIGPPPAPRPIGSTAELVDALGAAQYPVGTDPTSALEVRPRPPKDVDRTAVVSTRTDGRYEYWVVDSLAMQREVQVEVLRATTDEAAPVLYLLDGVDSPENPSGWRSEGELDTHPIVEDDVHVVIPTGAYASYWTDWESDDPVLGRNKWETFLTEELPRVVATHLNATDQAAVGGISMGAQAALHLAATTDLYDAVMAFSGHYSTMDPLGFQTRRVTVESRGGDVENMWGPRGSERWRQNDTISHVRGLGGKKVFFAAGNGIIGPDDLAVYQDDQQAVIGGTILERGVHEGTTAFQRALIEAGIDHRVDYAATGLHNWSTFMASFDAGWEYIKSALED